MVGAVEVRGSMNNGKGLLSWGWGVWRKELLWCKATQHGFGDNGALREEYFFPWL